MNRLNTGDKIFIRGLGWSGKVLSARDLESPEEDSIYEVQITRYFRRSALEVEVHDPQVSAAQRQASLADKMARMEAARIKLERATEGPEDLRIAAAIEYFQASDGAWKELGYAPLLEPIE